MHRAQQNISRKAKIDPQKVNAQIYNNRSIVFDPLLNDYFVGASYTAAGRTLNFVEYSKDKVSRISGLHKLLRCTSEIYGSYPQLVNQKKIVLSFKFAGADWTKIKDRFSEILEVTPVYLGNELCYILNVGKNKGVNLAEYLDKPGVEYTSIKGDSNEFFLGYARSHGLSDYIYKLNDRGFLAAEHKMGISMLHRVNKHSYKDLLAYFPDSFHELEDVTYTAEAPKVLSANKRNLLVLLSYTNKSNENMVDHYYSHPFPFISNSIMPNTYIIRMADVSDAFGNHGLSTEFDENTEDNIQHFIKSLMGIYGVDKKNVVICGISSGGTGTICHGPVGGYKTFAIDPLLGNHGYCGGKDLLYLYSIHAPVLETFRKLSGVINHNLGGRVTISSAKVLEFYPDIKGLKEVLPTVVLCEFDLEKIQKHIDFLGNTVFLFNTITNNLLLGTHVADSDINLDQVRSRQTVNLGFTVYFSNT